MTWSAAVVAAAYRHRLSLQQPHLCTNCSRKFEPNLHITLKIVLVDNFSGTNTHVEKWAVFLAYRRVPSAAAAPVMMVVVVERLAFEVD